MCSGVRPTIRFASWPNATTRPGFSTATTDGSSTTTRPRQRISVFEVPRSRDRSWESSARACSMTIARRLRTAPPGLRRRGRRLVPEARDVVDLGQGLADQLRELLGVALEGLVGVVVEDAVAAGGD